MNKVRSEEQEQRLFERSLVLGGLWPIGADRRGTDDLGGVPDCPRGNSERCPLSSSCEGGDQCLRESFAKALMEQRQLQ